MKEKETAMTTWSIYCDEGDRRNDENGRKRSRARKIFHLLEERNKQGTNVHHLETEMSGDMLKVAPLALAAIQIYGQRKERKQEWDDVTGDFVTMEKTTEQLSITYELIRGWHVTMFDGHNT